MRLRIAALLALIMGALLLGGIASPAASTGATAPSAAPQAAEEKITVQGRLINKSTSGQTNVAGATITVTDASGEETTTESDENGQYSVDVPYEQGDLTVELDESTLPEGVALREGARNPIRVKVESTLPVTITFVLGPGDRQVASALDQIPQNLYNGLYFGVILALGALGLSMIFGTTGLTNFAHGELVTFGAILTYTFNATFGLSIWIAALLAIAFSAAFGLVQDLFFWRPLRNRGTGLIAMMIVSIGLQFFLRNIFQFFTGGRTANYREYTTPPGITLGPVTYTVRDLVCLGVAIVLLLSVTLALSRTRIGRATRAIADNPSLAASTGINVNRVITIVWTVGTLLAGTCGVLLGFSQSVKFDLGAQILLVMFAAITVGGLGSIWGAIVGSLVVGMLIEMSTMVIPSELKIAAALFVLILILLVRPQGLFGRRERIG